MFMCLLCGLYTQNYLPVCPLTSGSCIQVRGVTHQLQRVDNEAVGVKPCSLL